MQQTQKTLNIADSPDEPIDICLCVCHVPFLFGTQWRPAMYVYERKKILLKCERCYL